MVKKIIYNKAKCSRCFFCNVCALTLKKRIRSLIPCESFKLNKKLIATKVLKISYKQKHLETIMENTTMDLLRHSSCFYKPQLIQPEPRGLFDFGEEDRNKIIKEKESEPICL